MIVFGKQSRVAQRLLSANGMENQFMTILIAPNEAKLPRNDDVQPASRFALPVKCLTGLQIVALSRYT